MMRKHSLNMLLHNHVPALGCLAYISLPNGQSLPYPRWTAGRSHRRSGLVAYI